jgi:hypothetical protein
MTMNVIKFYNDLLVSSPSPIILEFLSPKIPYFLSTLAPDADPFLSLVSAGTCELLTTLLLRPESHTLDTQYNILASLETHALNTASPTYLPALIAFSTIAATDGMFTYIDGKVWDQYSRMIMTRPITAEKLTSLGIVLSNSNPAESTPREHFFKFDLNSIVTPYVNDPTMSLAPITLLSALAGHKWGVKLIADNAVIMGWLMERTGEYMATTGKFAVVKKMLNTAVEDGSGHGHGGGHGPLGRWGNHVEVFVQRGEWWRDPVVEVTAEGG